MQRILILLIILITSTVTMAQEKRAMTVEDLWAMKRISSFDLSPDGRTLAFEQTEYDMEKNSGKTEIWLINSDGSNLRKFKETDKDISEPKFSPDGRLTYVYDKQIMISDLNGENEEKLTELYTGASGIRFDKDGKRFLFVSKVYPDCTTQECNEEKDKQKENEEVKAKIFDELMFRHWNEWRGDKRSHLFMKDLAANEVYDLTLNAAYEVPPVALGSSHDYDISPDGKQAAFTANKDKQLAVSTNNEVYTTTLTDLNQNEPAEQNKISESKGNDNQPVYSPDGKYIAFRSMNRAGFEADKYSLILFDRNSGSSKNLTENLDIKVDEVIWSPDSKTIYYNAPTEIYNSIYKIDIETGKNELLLKEVVSKNLVVSQNGEQLFFLNQKSTLPSEIFVVNTDGSNLQKITAVNKELLSQIEMNEVETFETVGAEGDSVQSILVKPPFFDPSKKYPLIFLIHGGPQGHWTDDFHYRWNLQLFASKGYVIVAPNPRGSVGYGQKFTDEISQDWGGKVFTDLVNSYDYALENFDYIDSANTFAAGASYGGYMVNWLAGHTNRFNALVSHAGVYNLESMYGVTEELWFPEWEFGGAPWENRELYQKWSPHYYADKIETPMLVIHGANDFRVPEGQAFELFTTLQRRGIESKLLYFPDEYHFVTKPKNARLWWNTIFDWFDKYKVN